MTNAPIKFSPDRERLIKQGLIVPGDGNTFTDDDMSIPPGVKLNAAQLAKRGFTIAAAAKREYEQWLAERNGQR